MIPDYSDDVEAAQVKYADAWSHAHVEGDPRKHEWIKLFAADLHKKDKNVALNGKRGNPADLSMDAINILCDASESDGRTPEGLPCVVVDVIGGAGGSNPTPAWTVFTDKARGSGARVIPGAAPMPQPVPPPAPSVSYPDEGTFWVAFQERMRKAYSDKGRAFPDPADADAYRRFSRCGFDIGSGMPPQKAADKHISELRQELGV